MTQPTGSAWGVSAGLAATVLVALAGLVLTVLEWSSLAPTDAVTKLADLVEELAPEPDELPVVERGVDGRDEVASLAEDRDAQRFLPDVLPSVLVNVRHRPS